MGVKDDFNDRMRFSYSLLLLPQKELTNILHKYPVPWNTVMRTHKIVHFCSSWTLSLQTIYSLHFLLSFVRLVAKHYKVYKRRIIFSPKIFNYSLIELILRHCRRISFYVKVPDVLVLGLSKYFDKYLQSHCDVTSNLQKNKRFMGKKRSHLNVFFVCIFLTFFCFIYFNF